MLLWSWEDTELGWGLRLAQSHRNPGCHPLGVLRFPKAGLPVATTRARARGDVTRLLGPSQEVTAHPGGKEQFRGQA